MAKATFNERSEILKQASVEASEDTSVGGVKMNPISTISDSFQKEPSFDPSKYPKPGEFFAAYERFLFAQREWQKQSGTFVKETYKYQPPSRRPELPGKRRGVYKHTYKDSNLSSLIASENETLLITEQRNNVNTADREVNDSIPGADENKLKDILTELLACSPDELEGDAGVKLLEEKLKIKPIDKEMLSLPELPEFPPDLRRMEFKTRSIDKQRVKGIKSDFNSSMQKSSCEVGSDMQTNENVLMNVSEANRNTSRREKDAYINEETEQLDNMAIESFAVEEENIPFQQVFLLTGESSKSPNTTLEQYIQEQEEHIQEQHEEENDNTDTASGLQVANYQEEEAHNSSPKQAKKTTKVKKLTREAKVFSRRNSLAGAGTKWENGVRRSTRIKSRPLEYWRGERFLYGRVHESLPTVIGMTYESPGKGKGETNKLMNLGAGTKWENGVRRSTRIRSRPLEYWRGLPTVIGIMYESPGRGKSEGEH
ncbi:unnamed protein product [Eruca vesicaria subsp. sativa]|uniref:Uncharacterized protein n=1 Tax=Eruca vesicaria subsp. sativa TaxID=29727 RepID=A0ABC8LFV4_ERUVS|nr:unnamed protein product [Eruca vesicaria subsp. sativa]